MPGRGRGTDRGDSEVAASAPVEQSTKDRGAVEARQAEPVDGPRPADQRRRPEITDHAVLVKGRVGRVRVHHSRPAYPARLELMDVSRPATMQQSPEAEVIGRLEEAGWLESTQQVISKAIQPVVNKAEETGVMDVLHGHWLGHALHPVLSDLPIGFWTASVVLDALDMGDAAAVMSASGSAAAVGAALTGIADWTVTDGRERRLGLLHGLLNTGGLVLQLGSLTS